MDHSINTRPLLEDFEDNNESEEQSSDNEIEKKEIAVGPIPKGNPPKDWYAAGFLTFYLLGIITLLPYTFFVTANDYWMYKLRDTSQNVTSFENKTSLQAEFTSYMTIAATFPSVFFMIINSMFSHRISLEIRMFGSLTIILLCFILTTILVEVDTDAWQDAFFYITLATVVVVNVIGAFLQASLLGIACKFSSRFMTAVVSGQALGGLFPAIVYIASLAIGASSVHCALLYFCIANVTLIVSLVAYYLLSRSLFFRFNMMVGAPANTLQYDPMQSTASLPHPDFGVAQVLRKSWPYGVTAMVCYIVTISVYPGVTVLITSESQRSLWTDKYFVPVVTFLVFSIWDYIGRVCAGIFKWPILRPWLLLSLSTLRLIGVPLILLCNAQPRHNLPVLIPNDSGYIVIACLLAFTNGYVTNITMINIPKSVDDAEQEMASSIVATFISIGCAIGAICSYLFIRII